MAQQTDATTDEPTTNDDDRCSVCGEAAGTFPGGDDGEELCENCHAKTDRGGTVRDKLIHAFHIAGNEFDASDIQVDTTPDIKGRIGEVTVEMNDGSLTLSDPHGDTLQAALGFHGWEAALLSLTDDGTGVEIAIWEATR